MTRAEAVAVVRQEVEPVLGSLFVGQKLPLSVAERIVDRLGYREARAS